MHPFRFGVAAGSASSGDEWAALARRAESLGYGAFTVPDHFMRQLAPMAALGAAAAATRTIRIGSYVFANDFRHPLVTARESASLDVLSDGRFEVGLGAGWARSDYRQLGRDYDAPGRRIDRLEEAIPIITRLLSGEKVTHHGRHYRLDGAELHPRPIQRPRPPLFIGGGGPRMLRLAAREAEIVGLLPKFSARGLPMVSESTDAATERKVRVLRRAAGERFDALELNVLAVDVGLIDRREGLGALAASVKSLAPRLIGGSPYVLYGTLDGLRDELLRRRERTGISYYTIYADAIERAAPLVEALSGR